MRPNGHGTINRGKTGSSQSSDRRLSSLRTKTTATERGCPHPQQRSDAPMRSKTLRDLESGNLLRVRTPALRCVAWLAALLLFAISGCSRSSGPAANPPVPTPRWKWESFPLVHRMRLGVLPCRVLPKSSQTINSPFNATLHLNVDLQQTNLPGGFVWAEFEPKTLRAQSNALEEARVRLRDRERYMLEVDWPAKKLEVAKKMEDSRFQVAVLQALS